MRWEGFLFFDFCMFAMLMYRSFAGRQRKDQPVKVPVRVLQLLVKDGELLVSYSPPDDGTHRIFKASFTLRAFCFKSGVLRIERA